MQFCVFKHIFRTVKRSKIFFLVKLGHSNMPNLFALKNHHLHRYFQKLTKSRFFQTHEHTSQTRGICPCFIHFQKKKKTTIIIFSKKKNQIIKILRFPKNHAFIFKLRAFGFGSFNYLQIPSEPIKISLNWYYKTSSGEF